MGDWSRGKGLMLVARPACEAFPSQRAATALDDRAAPGCLGQLRITVSTTCRGPSPLIRIARRPIPPLLLLVPQTVRFLLLLAVRPAYRLR
jgi:hypothetical protein